MAGRGEDDIYSVVSGNSNGGVELHNIFSSDQSLHALPYETAVFQGQTLSDNAQMLQDKTDSKVALYPYDQVDHNKHNQEHCLREHQMWTQANDEYHMYDEVKHEVKEGQSKSVENETRGGNDKESTKLFDDMVYEERNVTVHAKSTTNMNADDYAEPTAPKKQKDQPRFDDEHLYDSTDHNMSKGQIPTVSVESDSTKFKGEADGAKHTYRSLESPETGEFASPNNYILIGHQRTALQDTNKRSGDYDPSVYNCQFDDPMYESNPHPGADLTAIVSPSSTKAESDVIELQDDKSATCMQGKPLNYSVDAESFVDTPQLSDVYASKDNHVIMDSQDKADRNLASTYDVFDDATYGVCHAGVNKK